MDKELWNATEDILMELGVFPRNKTFGYCCEAVQLMSEGIDDSSVYKVIASRHGTTANNVRNTCNYAMNKISADNLKSVFGNAVPDSIGDFLGALFIRAKRKCGV